MAEQIQTPQVVTVSRDAAANIMLASAFGSAVSADHHWSFAAGLLMGVALILIILIMRSDLAQLEK